jgi:hypothetical protein
MANLSQKIRLLRTTGGRLEKQYETFRPKVTKESSDEEFFRVLCEMLAPLKDGHVNLKARGAFKGKFNPEDKPFFHREFAKQRLIDDLFRLAEKKVSVKPKRHRTI